MDDINVYQFRGKITYSRYYNYDTNWGVYGFSTNDEIPYFINKSESNNLLFENNNISKEKFGVIAGKMQELIVGNDYIIKATFKVDKKYGEQYSPISISPIIPDSPETQKIFLKSIISENIANNLLEVYPNLVNDVINGLIDEIDYEKVKGVGNITWKKIKEKIIDNYIIADIILLLQPIGVTYTMIKKLLSDEPNPVLLVQKLQDNPYIILKIDGIGWKKADELALKLKPEMETSLERLTAYVLYYLKELGNNSGHTWISKDILLNAITNNLPECQDLFEYFLNNNDLLHIENEKIGLQYYYQIEKSIFNIILQKIQHKCSWDIEDSIIVNAVSKAETEQGFKYVDEQLNIIYKSLHRNVSIITGVAGTGKTSIMRGIIKAYNLNHNSIYASALSAMAAQRITEATGYPAMTIHRTLGCKGLNEFTFNKDNKIPTDVAFLDEGSMVNAELFLRWLEAIDDNTRIIIAGDSKQLPPIGFGNIFSDLIDKINSSCISRLTKPMRQALKSGVLVDANLIRENKNPVTEGFKSKIIHGELNDMYYMFRTNRQSLFNIAINTFFASIKTDGVDNVAIVVPRKQGCLNSTFEINNYIQNKLLEKENIQIESSTRIFKLGAKVLQTVNDYDRNVFNGDIGYIVEINEDTISDEKDKSKTKKQPYCIVKFINALGEEKRIKYTKKDLTTLDLAYALTTHKIQGGSRKTIIGVIDNTHYNLLDNCMLYTMMTRAKQRCLLLAEPDAFNMCIRTSHNKRNTWMSLKK